MTLDIFRMRGRSKLAVALLLIASALALSVGVCTFKSHMLNSAFDAVQMGETEAAVVGRVGAPSSMREKSGKLFTRYASLPCVGQCVERIWFENRMSLDTEAWSVELDKNGRVVKKSKWVSP